MMILKRSCAKNGKMGKKKTYTRNASPVPLGGKRWGGFQQDCPPTNKNGSTLASKKGLAQDQKNNKKKQGSPVSMATKTGSTGPCGGRQGVLTQGPTEYPWLPTQKNKVMLGREFGQRTTPPP